MKSEISSNVKNRGKKNFSSKIVWIFLGTFVLLLLWMHFSHLDEVARATGTVITNSRTQIIQSVDGGVLKQLNVKEGDKVKEGDILALFDEKRTQAALIEI